MITTIAAIFFSLKNKTVIKTCCFILFRGVCRLSRFFKYFYFVCFFSGMYSRNGFWVFGVAKGYPWIMVNDGSHHTWYCMRFYWRLLFPCHGQFKYFSTTKIRMCLLFSMTGLWDICRQYTRVVCWLFYQRFSTFSLRSSYVWSHFWGTTMIICLS